MSGSSQPGRKPAIGSRRRGGRFEDGPWRMPQAHRDQADPVIRLTLICRTCNLAGVRSPLAAPFNIENRPETPSSRTYVGLDESGQGVEMQRTGVRVSGEILGDPDAVWQPADGARFKVVALRCKAHPKSRPQITEEKLQVIAVAMRGRFARGTTAAQDLPWA